MKLKSRCFNVEFHSIETFLFIFISSACLFHRPLSHHRRNMVLFIHWLLKVIINRAFVDLVKQSFTKGHFLINRLRAIWPKGYQRGSLRKSHQNGDFLKASNAKKLPSRRNRTCSLRITGPLLYHLS